MRPSPNAALALVTLLFFAWGFVAANNEPLVAALRASFELTYSQALLTQIVSFAAFGLVSLPAAAFMARFGPTWTITWALAVMSAGCLLVGAACAMQRFELILLAIFVVAGGIAALQVAANPLAVMLGAAESSHFRLTLAQAFNSLGVVIGVSFGSAIMLAAEGANEVGIVALESTPSILLSRIGLAFGIIGACLAGLLAIIWSKRRQLDRHIAVPLGRPTSPLAALGSAWAVAGALAIAAYVGAEVSIASVMINFLNQDAILGVSLEAAGFYLANVYWLGALVGRFAGSYALTRVSAARLLACAAAIAASLAIVVVLSAGLAAALCALAIGFFNSVMFPTIFSITLERSAAPRAAVSGLLCVAIAAGGVLPYVVGATADRLGLSASFTAPALAYLVVLWFGLRAGAGRSSSASTG